MTLIATFASSEFVTQVSDRRFLLPSGRIGTDRGNKAIVLACADGLLSIAFAGLAMFNHKRVDLTLSERLHQLAVARLSLDDAVQTVTDECSTIFNVVPRDKRHLVFTLAGYRTMGDRAEPRLLLITNVDTAGGFEVDAMERFQVHNVGVTPGKATILLSGSGAAAVSRGDKRRLQARAIAVAGNPISHDVLNRVEDGIVTLIRAAAERANGTVGRDCMAISLTPLGDARALYYPGRSQPKCYGPTCLWTAAGANYVVADIEQFAGAGYAVSFGGGTGRFRLLVDSSDRQHQAPPKTLMTAFRFASKGPPSEAVKIVGVHAGAAFR